MLKFVKLQEPQFFQDLLLRLNNLVMSHKWLKQYVILSADIFVFTYPILLIMIYLYGIGKKILEYKIAALYIFFSSMIGIIISIIIQQFINKSRPEQSVLNKKELLLDHIPDAPFPSDHATVAFGIAGAMTFWGIRHNHKFILRLSYLFRFFAINIAVSRVAVGVHRPSDVIVGALLGTGVAYVLIRPKIFDWMREKVYYPLVKIERRIMLKLFDYKQ